MPIKRSIHKKKGIALVLALVVMMLLIAFCSILLLRVMTQRLLVGQKKNLTQAYYLAEGAANAGLFRLNRIINGAVLNRVNSGSPDTIKSQMSSYVNNSNGMEFLIDFSKEKGVGLLTLTEDWAVYKGLTVI